MKTKTLFLLTIALLPPLTARAQPPTQTAPQQPAKRYSGVDDDPQFKRLSPEQQELVRKAMQNLDKAVANDQKNPANPDDTKPRLPIPPVQVGCPATPVKPRFRLPKALQDAVNPGKLKDMTGVDLGQAAKDAPKDAQGKPCPPSPAAPAKPKK